MVTDNISLTKKKDEKFNYKKFNYLIFCDDASISMLNVMLNK